MEQRNEPSTAEIVKALRCVAEETECKDCRYKYPVGNVILCDHEQMNGNAADRLESQERTIAELTEKLEQAELTRDMLCGTIREAEEPKTECSSTFVLESGNDIIAELTARAEKAEADRDAAIADAEKAPSCGVCDHADCQYCFHGDMFTWRGMRGKGNA